MQNTAWSQESTESVRTEKIFQWWDYPLYAALTLLNLVVTVYFLVYWWFTAKNWLSAPILFIPMTILLLVNLAMYHSRWLLVPFVRRPVPMRARSGWKVGVATTFVPGAESIEMLEVTLRHLVAMDYPHDTWVLDEGDDPQVRALCRRYGAYHFSRKDLPQYQAASGTFESRTKHGNYNAWLYELGFKRYEIIAAFDPDHIPKPDFLLQVLGYFDDPHVGYVQGAQVYYNQKASFIARGAAEETYSYYSLGQMVNYAMGQPVVTGCHNTHRVTALEQVGGFAPHEADDVLITVLYRTHGWSGVYIPRILGEGLTPVDWSSYLIQQRRWARSVLDIKFRIYPKLVGTLPWIEQLMTFYHGLYYFELCSTPIQLTLLTIMLVTGITPAVVSFGIVPGLALLWGTLQLCDFYKQRFYLDPRRECGLHWCAGILRAAKWPYILLGLYDAIFRYSGPYTITRKVRAKTRQRMLIVPFLLVVMVIGTAWAIGTFNGRITNSILHLGAATTIVSALAVIAMEYLKFPDPYDPTLVPKYPIPKRFGGLNQLAASRQLSRTLVVPDKYE